LVVDASETEATRRTCEALTERIGEPLRLIYHPALRPGLARQRNEALEVCRPLGVAVVHFIDDDTEVAAGYFHAIERRFRDDETVSGLGGVIVNQPVDKYLGFKCLFLLTSRRRGVVLRSGRNTLGQYPGTRATDHVDWLNGCSMSFRISVFDDFMFDERRNGYSLGEDSDFTFRVSRRYKLAVEPSALSVHHFTPMGRWSARRHARHRTEMTYAWVVEHRMHELSLTAYWWSVLGDFLLRFGYGVLRRDRAVIVEALGVAEGVMAIARGRVRR